MASERFASLVPNLCRQNLVSRTCGLAGDIEGCDVDAHLDLWSRQLPPGPDASGWAQKELRDVARQATAPLARCAAEAARTDHTYRGNLSAFWSIDPAGQVTEVTLVDAPNLSLPLATCITDALSTLSFPSISDQPRPG